jgi:hypothetical protein
MKTKTPQRIHKKEENDSCSFFTSSDEGKIAPILLCEL